VRWAPDHDGSWHAVTLERIRAGAYEGLFRASVRCGIKPRDLDGCTWTDPDEPPADWGGGTYGPLPRPRCPRCTRRQ
jgi:hypothetical protein